MELIISFLFPFFAIDVRGWEPLQHEGAGWTESAKIRCADSGRKKNWLGEFVVWKNTADIFGMDRSGRGWQWRPQLLARFTSTAHINTPLLHMTEFGIKSSPFTSPGRKPGNNARTSTRGQNPLEKYFLRFYGTPQARPRLFVRGYYSFGLYYTLPSHSNNWGLFSCRFQRILGNTLYNRSL